MSRETWHGCWHVSNMETALQQDRQLILRIVKMRRRETMITIATTATTTTTTTNATTTVTTNSNYYSCCFYFYDATNTIASDAVADNADGDGLDATVLRCRSSPRAAFLPLLVCRHHPLHLLLFCVFSSHATFLLLGIRLLTATIFNPPCKELCHCGKTR